MPSSRDRIAMTEPEVADFLGSHVKVQVATIGPAGEPHLTTLFYVVDDGKVAFWTFGRSQKVVNLRRDPRISALVEDGTAYDELRGVSITGTARIVTDYDAVRRIGGLVMTAMAGDQVIDAETQELADAVVEQQAHKRVVIVVEPDHVASWDHGKMAG
ncbi:MAG: pyridoxamine 5-phosphate oxidase [Nocardioidaceae bacterium]|nr:pyridoxamine 5-phosphate oxidase [Nocardioidaceae bacterium]